MSPFFSKIRFFSKFNKLNLFYIIRDIFIKSGSSEEDASNIWKVKKKEKKIQSMENQLS